MSKEIISTAKVRPDGICVGCDKECPTTFRAMLGNIVLTEFYACSRKCVIKAMPFVQIKLDTALECDIDKHIEAKCHCTLVYNET